MLGLILALSSLKFLLDLVLSRSELYVLGGRLS